MEFQGSGWAEVLAIEFNDRLQEEQIQTNNMIASKSSRLPALRVKRSEAPRDHFAAKSLKAQLQDSAFPCTRKETASLKPRDHFCAKIKTSCDSPMCKCLVPEEKVGCAVLETTSKLWPFVENTQFKHFAQAPK